MSIPLPISYYHVVRCTIYLTLANQNTSIEIPSEDYNYDCTDIVLVVLQVQHIQLEDTLYTQRISEWRR